MGKESIPAQFFKATFLPEEEYGFEPPQEPTIHKSIPKCLQTCPTLPPCWQEAILPMVAWLALVPAKDPQLSRAVNSKPVPANGTPTFAICPLSPLPMKRNNKNVSTIGICTNDSSKIVNFIAFLLRV